MYSPSASFFEKFIRTGIGEFFLKIFFLSEAIDSNAVFYADSEYAICFVLQWSYDDKNYTTLKRPFTIQDQFRPIPSNSVQL